MPEISLLEAEILNGVIEELEYPDSFAGTKMLGAPEASPWPIARWDVEYMSRSVAVPNMPNTEAKIVPHLGVGQRTASFIYLREKKIFKPTTLHWLRTPGQLAMKNAERYVMKEIKDLDRRFMAFAEFCVWQMFSGELVLDYPDVKATVNYNIDATHKPTVTTPWSDADADIIGDVIGWKRRIAEDGAAAMTREIWMNGETFEYIGKNTTIRGLFSDRLRDQYLGAGEVLGLLGLNWMTYDAMYQDSNGDLVKYIPNDRAFLYADNPERPFYMMEGPSADHEAPANTIGKFAKTWMEPDPSNRQYLCEWHFLPILERPDQVMWCDLS